MKRQISAIVVVVLISAGLLLVLFHAVAAPAATTPVVSEVEPSSVTNDSASTIVITGTEFAVVLSGADIITLPTIYLDATSLGDAGWVSSATLTTTVPMGFPAGVYTVTVTNPDGQSGSLADGLTVQNPAPVVQSVTPVSSTYGQTPVLTITGTGFVATPAASLGGVSCSAQYVSSTTLTTTVPGELGPGTHTLIVQNPGPGSPQHVVPGAFTLYSPVPTVTSCEPASGANDLDMQVVITGTSFAPTPAAALDGTPLEQVVWVSLTQLTAVVPWGMDEGLYTLTVTNPAPGASSATLPNAFAVTQGIGVWNASELYGGSVEYIAVNSFTPTILYASTGAGTFRSQDGADRWNLLTSSILNPVVVDPTSLNRLYGGGAPHPGGFLWRSEDGGDTWIPVTTTFPIVDSHDSNDRWCWSQIKIYTMPGAVYVSDCGGDGGPSETGLLKSTDNGESWELLSAGLADPQISALAFDPTDPLTMYVGTVNGNVFVSSDGGDSWTFASRPVSYVHHIAVSPTGAHEVWVSAGNSYGESCGLYKSAPADLTTWTLIGEPAGHPGRLWCGSKTIFAPAAWPAAYSTTITILSEGDIFTSTDGGTNFGTIPLGELSGSFRELALHPTDPSILYAGQSGEGFFRSTDGGSSWQIANHGLTALVPQELRTQPGHPDQVYALALGRIYRGTQGGGLWQRLPISAATTIMFDPYTPTRLYAGGTGGIHISEDAGLSWPIFAAISRPVEYADCWMSVSALAASPSQPGALIAAMRHFNWEGECAYARGSLWRSTDYGDTWMRINLSQEISQVNAIVADTLDPLVMYAAIGNDVNNMAQTGGTILKSSDGGATWTSTGDWQVDGIPLMLEMEPGTHRVFASVSNLLPLYVSEDGGMTWTPTAFGGGHNVQDILFTSGSPRVLYDAAQQGLYRSTDGGQSWQRAAGALGRVPVYCLDAAEAEGRVILYAGTTGGQVQTDAAQTMDRAGTDSTLVNAGVYRYTTRLPTEHVYLPLVLRAHEQQGSLRRSEQDLGSRAVSKAGSSYPSSRPEDNARVHPALRAVLASGVLMVAVTAVVAVVLHRPAYADDARRQSVDGIRMAARR